MSPHAVLDVLTLIVSSQIGNDYHEVNILFYMFYISRKRRCVGHSSDVTNHEQSFSTKIPRSMWTPWISSDHFVYAPSQWETTLQCNVASHWLGAYTKWNLDLRNLDIENIVLPGVANGLCAHESVCSGSAGASVVAHSVALPLIEIAFWTLDCSIVPTCGAWGSATAAKHGPLKQSWAGI